MGNQRDQVGQRLTCARPCLDQQMLAGLDGPGHMLCHFLLPGAALATQTGNSLLQQFEGKPLPCRFGGLRRHLLNHW